MRVVIIILYAYLLVINLDGFLITRSDKRRAQRGKRRIPEAALFLTAVLGGGVGVYAAMKRYRHKTLHTSFTVGIPLIIFFEAVLITAALLWAYLA